MTSTVETLPRTEGPVFRAGRLPTGEGQTDEAERALLRRLARALSTSTGPELRDELTDEVVGAVLDGGSPTPRAAAEHIASLQLAVTVALWGDVDRGRLPLALERLASVMAGAQAGVVDRMLSAQARRLEEVANTDPLTGLGNVRVLRERLADLIALHRRYGHRFGVLLVDVDDFKRVNDRFGHAEGDRLLVRLGGIIRGAVRESDVGVRLGGDEFCVLAPADTIVPVRILAARLAASVRRARAPDGKPTSVSIGIAFCPCHGSHGDRLLDLADRAMYAAKASRRHTAIALPGEVER